MKASHRHHKNNNDRLKDEMGVWREKEDMHQVITKHFNELFSAPTHSTHVDFQSPLAGTISEDMNQDITRIFTPGKVKEALFYMHPSKALNPEGMSPIFYQKYWHIIGPIITDAIISALNSNTLLHALNHT